MPTYEYLCETCGRFEEFQKMTEAPLSKCPKCQGRVTKLISGGGGILFKGSGFYSTDYRKPEYQKKSKEEQGTKPSAESKPKGESAGGNGKDTGSSASPSGGSSKETKS